MSYGGFANKRPQPVQEIPIQVQKHETPFDSRYPNAKSAPGMNEFPTCAKFDGNCVGYSVHEYPRFDSFIHPQTNFTRNTTDHPGYMRLALMSNIQRENARFHNGCFNSFNKTLGRVGEDVGYLVPKSLIPCERYIAELPGFQRENARSYVKTVLLGRTLNGYLYPMDESHYQGTLRSAQLPRMRLGFSYQL